jgi:hypothetical protein
MGKEYWLSWLQVCISGHNDIQIALCQIHEGLAKGCQLCEHMCHLITQVHPNIQHHLIVSAPCSVKFLRNLPDFSCEPGLDIHMDIFK